MFEGEDFRSEWMAVHLFVSHLINLPLFNYGYNLIEEKVIFEI